MNARQTATYRGIATRLRHTDRTIIVRFRERTWFSYPCTMLRHLRTAAALAFKFACALAIVMWMRSQRWQDTLYYVPSHGSRIYRIDTYVGRAYIGRGAWIPGFAVPALSLSGELHEDEATGAQPENGFFGLKRGVNEAYTGIYVPYWLLTLLFGSMAVALEVKRITRFGLKQLFVATTFVAIVLGVGLAVTRSGSAFYWRLL
jgi:hypothetical protein